VLAVAGFGMFAMLVRNVDFSRVMSATEYPLPLLIAGILALAFVNYCFDTMSWWLVCGRHRPSFMALMSIRARAEAITNTLPGGALIGEPMKVSLLLRATTMSRAEATTSFLLSKFSLITGQVFYVVVGVALSYEVINGASIQTFGTGNFAWLVLGAATTILLLMVTLVVAMVWLQPMLRWLVPTRRTGRWHQRWNVLVAEAHAIESLIAEAARRQGWQLGLSILCGFIAWSFNAIEAYLIVQVLGIGGSFAQIYAIDSVSCIVRMVLFVLPIGIGGQDWTIAGLMGAYGFADPVGASAKLVTLKRGREFLVIGIGLALLLVMPRQRAPLEEGMIALAAQEEELKEEQQLAGK
jgi:hypothetical protein